MKKSIDNICWLAFGFLTLTVSCISLFDVGICLSYGLVIPSIVLIVAGLILLILTFKIFSLGLRK